MKKIILVFFILAGVMNLFGGDNSHDALKAISFYKPNYVILGYDSKNVDFLNEYPEYSQIADNIESSMLKISFSFKYEIFKPYKIGFYVGMNQRLFFSFFQESAPMQEIIFSPEVFWRFESGYNFAGDLEIPVVDYVQIGLWEHMSNGGFGELSRAWERVYVQTQLSVGPSYLKAGLNMKVFYFWKTIENPEIADNVGNFEAMVFAKLVDPDKQLDLEELYIKSGIGYSNDNFDVDKLWVEAGVSSRPLFGRVRGYAQFWHGYGESLIAYNEKTTAIRAGIILE